jgi:pyruvate/2-oxoglutarate dehydrogenase complex dihydrolipoamide acyltransferase (E2) component
VLAYLEGNGAAKEEAPMHIESPDKPEPVAKKAAPAAGGQPLSRMRQSIGKAMIDSLRTAATCTTIIEADMTRIARDREQTGLTWLPYVARATIETLREFPSLNATLEGDTFTQYDSVNLGIAVSLGEGGLIVPVIRDAQNLSVEGLGKEIKALARKARDNQLTPDDVRGGTFTITNPGGYGSIMATPVINQPQVAILDTEAVVKRPVVITDELGNDSIAVRPMTYLCMSWDHRALDGALAAQFLNGLRKKLESWPINSVGV